MQDDDDDDLQDDDDDDLRDDEFTAAAPSVAALVVGARFISQFSAHLSAHDLWAGHDDIDDDDDYDDYGGHD